MSKNGRTPEERLARQRLYQRLKTAHCLVSLSHYSINKNGCHSVIVFERDPKREAWIREETEEDLFLSIMDTADPIPW